MSIKIAVLNHDEIFIKRLSMIFQKKYSDEMTLLYFGENEICYERLAEEDPDIILLDEEEKTDIQRLPQKAICCFLSEKADKTEVSNFPAVFKYQRADDIYKALLRLYESVFHENMIPAVKESGTRIVLFTSAQGGCGTTVASVSYALRRAGEQKQIIYLDMDPFGNSNLYFQSEKNEGFSAVIDELTEKKENISLAINRLVQKDPSGVHFFNPCENAEDMMELPDDKFYVLLYNLAKYGGYEEIIIDHSCDLSTRIIETMNNYSDRIVYVTDGSVSGRDKFQRFCEAVKKIEDRDLCNIKEKMVLLYNRFAAESRTITESAIPEVAGILYYGDASGRKLTEKIAALDSLKRI